MFTRATGTSPTDPTQTARGRRLVRSSRIATAAAVAVSAVATVALTHGAHAQTTDGTLAPPSSETATVPPTTPPTSEPPTTVTATTTPTTTAAPTTTTPTTVVPTTTVSTTRPSTTKKPGFGVVNPNATGAVRIEVSISQQRLFLYRGGQLYRTVHVSTGSGRKYCEKGSCGVAHTPRGSFRVYSRVSGWRTSRLGHLYNPLYFSGGYAIHGARSVPNYPASHGCIRVSIGDAGWLPRVVPNGTPVRVF